MTPQWLLLLALTIPLIAAALISALDRHPNLRESVTVVASLLLCAVNLMLLNLWQNNVYPALSLTEPIPGLEIAFSVNGLGIIFAVLASSLWGVTGIYAIGYLRSHNEHHQTRFFMLFAIAITGVMAVAYSANLFTLFIFYEFITICTYPLVTHTKTEPAKLGGRRYLLILMGTSIGFFLPAIVYVWSTTGHVSFTIGGILPAGTSPIAITLLMLFFLFGIAKAGLMPFHKWLPGAMVAPTPVSALLHAVAVVKAGVFSIAKVVIYIIGPDNVLGALGYDLLLLLPIVTIILASLVALTRDNLKERLAYSTISQLSYIILGLLLANSAGLLGANLHIVMHAMAKITLFFAAGAILVTTHKARVSELNGLAKQMPITFVFFTIGCLSIIGLPLFGGMWSKWYLLQGAIAQSSTIGWIAMTTLLVSSLLNISYLLIIPINAWCKAPLHDVAFKEAPKSCLIAMAIPTLLTVILFFYPLPLMQILDLALSGAKP